MQQPDAARAKVQASWTRRMRHPNSSSLPPGRHGRGFTDWRAADAPRAAEGLDMLAAYAALGQRISQRRLMPHCRNRFAGEAGSRNQWPSHTRGDDSADAGKTGAKRALRRRWRSIRPRPSPRTTSHGSTLAPAEPDKALELAQTAYNKLPNSRSATRPARLLQEGPASRR
jgi:hypothetical protein